MKNAERLYCFLLVFFSTLIVVGNLTYQKFVSINLFSLHEFNLSVGAVLYPLTFLVTDIIAEFYGKEKSQFCVRIALLMNIITAIIIFGMDHLKALPWSRVDDDTFHHVFGMYGVAFLGSLLACYMSQSLDVLLYLFIKKITGGKFIWLRNLLSTSSALFLDTCFVISFMAAFGIFQWDRVGELIFNSYTFKIVFTLLNVPLFYIYLYLIKKFIATDE